MKGSISNRGRVAVGLEVLSVFLFRALTATRSYAILSQEESLFISQIGISVVAVVWGSSVLLCNGFHRFCSRFFVTSFPTEMAFFGMVLIRF